MNSTEAIAVADHSTSVPPEQIEAELEAWEQSLPQRTANLTKQLNSLPYPILFGSTDDLAWACELPNNSQPNQSEQEQTGAVQRKPKRSRTRKRKKQKTPRICVHFKGKGLSHLSFRVYCDRRQLPVFRQLVGETKVNKARKKEDKFSLSLCPLRSARLMWVEDPNQPKDQLPWQRHCLHLHMTIDPRLETAEGTEVVRQEKIELMQKFLKGLEQPTEAEIETLSDEEQALLTAEENRQKVTKKNQPTFTRLRNNPPPPRPCQVPYRGDPAISVKVVFSREHVVGVAVYDGNRFVLEYRDVKALLVDPHVERLRERSRKLQQQPERLRKAAVDAPLFTTAIVKRRRYDPKISSRQLQLQPWRLLKRLKRLKRKNIAERQEEQSRGLYRPSQAESNLAHHINHLLARNIVDLCQQWLAASIILSDFGNLRESIESEIQARAKHKYPDDSVDRQKQYAKEFRMEFHRWNYKDLIDCIRSRAAEFGISCVAGQQPRLGSLREKASAVVPIPKPNRVEERCYTR